MKKRALFFVILLLVSFGFSSAQSSFGSTTDDAALADSQNARGNFIRGDVNDDGELSIVDAMMIFNNQNNDGFIACHDAADADDNGFITHADGVQILNYLFRNGLAPPAPGPRISGADPTNDDLGCDCWTGVGSCIRSLGPQETLFKRGDVNDDGEIGLDDALAILDNQNNDGFVACEDAADADDNGHITHADAIMILNYLFSDGPKPPEPFDSVGIDGTRDGLVCECYTGDEACKEPKGPDSPRIDTQPPTDTNPNVRFERGDVNDDGVISLPDALMILNNLNEGRHFLCQDSADVDDSGGLNHRDARYLLNYLFSGGPMPKSPFGTAGLDPTKDRLSCLCYTGDEGCFREPPRESIAEEEVTCVFSGSSEEEKCFSGDFGCSGVDSCTAKVSVTKGSRLIWKSSCGGYSITTADGRNERAPFRCSKEDVALEEIETMRYENAYWTCYDGEGSKLGGQDCKLSSEWSKEARVFCEGHCNEEGKCGVNSFGVSVACYPDEDPIILDSDFSSSEEIIPDDVADSVACPADAKICSDGSAVSRSGPNCEFAECPSISGDEIEIEFNEGVLICTDSCGFEGSCVPIGYRADGQYCSLEGMLDQKATGERSENSFECRSNLSVDGECISGNLFRRVLEWFRSIFG